MTKILTRPKLHFAPQKNWINDPNGLVYFDGEWHLFYQYNPFGIEWGNMNWGHAVSEDLIKWEELGIAVKEDEDNMIFSGSCVIDWQNTSGFGDGANPPMIAIYTDHKKHLERQVQSIAYSLDRGRTFTKYENNPVIDIQKKDFRDPKVFWHDASKVWVMVVCNSSDNSLSIYNSPDLKKWEIKSEFGPSGINGHLWECPDLFPLIASDTGEEKWLLKVDVFEAEQKKYSLGQAFIGSFDGEKFIADKDENGKDIWQRIDFGHDFYAAMSWSDVPANDGRRIWTAWMNSHHYASKMPASSWRGSMTLPRELSLIRSKSSFQLVQNPIVEFNKLPRIAIDLNQTYSIKNNAFEIIATIQKFKSENTAVAICLAFGDSAKILFGFNPISNEIFVDRSKNIETSKIKEFSEIQSANRICDSDDISIQAIIDHNSIELFFDNGMQVFTETFYPPTSSFRIELETPDAISLEVFRVEN